MMSECKVTKVNLPKFPTPELVVLTLEEAKYLLSIVMDCKHAHCITQEEAEAFREFVKRIEQAEEKYE